MHVLLCKQLLNVKVAIRCRSPLLELTICPVCGPGQAASRSVRFSGQLLLRSLAITLCSEPCTCVEWACLRPTAVLPGTHLDKAEDVWNNIQ